MSRGTSKVDKLLKMPSHSIPEGVKFSWRQAPRLPSVDMSVNIPASLYIMETLMMALIA